jgi:hypothetical protein
MQVTILKSTKLVLKLTATDEIEELVLSQLGSATVSLVPNEPFKTIILEKYEGKQLAPSVISLGKSRPNS